VGDANVDAFAVLVEELDHLLCIAERASESRPLSLFELELHANVSKYLVIARFLAGRGRALDARRRAWLEYRLFHRETVAEEDETVRSRYRDADRWAFRLVSALPSLRTQERIELFRRFHSAAASAKLELIRGVAD
jgi:hypothetical protein